MSDYVVEHLSRAGRTLRYIVDTLQVHEAAPAADVAHQLDGAVDDIRRARAAFDGRHPSQAGGVGPAGSARIRHEGSGGTLAGWSADLLADISNGRSRRPSPPDHDEGDEGEHRPT